MTRYKVKFVVINSIPTDRNSADRLSDSITLEYGDEGWQLVSTSIISPGLLLAFQKEMSSE